ncbi:hypothetical protein GCK72_006147 [Caenorhabditis remanei]|uniref:Uncharacterized protein n=1 Tax=Caenorhabditis remanei TaxID=31234 RepID=A0A6A5HGQ0_CAERE|nr:hypothetical protein GCK72_006147 [Caenorhabditis remanei]KAF1766191.1 hypothetical protein GCK72_006147 [Caenorhabditis remanei]
MRISSKSRKIIGISNAILIGIMIFLESTQILLKSDKYLEFKNIGILEWLSDQDSLFLYSNLVISTLLIVSIVLLVIVFDVVISQESDHFHVGPRSYSKNEKICQNYLNYGESRKSRRLIDRIHVDYSCCGVKSIDDFVDLSEIDKSLPSQTKLWSCNEWEYCGVPLSCCKTVSCSQKVELLKEGWDPENITKQWFNRNGCIEKMENAYLFLSYPNYILTDFAMILVLGFHICSMILSQILITSSATLHTAHLETSEASYAWLIDVGQPDPLSLKLNPDIDLSEPKSSDHNEEYQGEENDNVEEIISLAACTTEKETKTEIETKNTESSTGTSSKGTSSTGATHASAVSASVMESPGQFSSNEVIIYDSDTGVAKRMPQKTKKTKGDSNLKKNKPKIARKNTETKRKQSKKPSGTNKGRNTKTKKAPNKNLKKKTTANQKKKK